MDSRCIGDQTGDIPIRDNKENMLKVLRTSLDQFDRFSSIRLEAETTARQARIKEIEAFNDVHTLLNRCNSSGLAQIDYEVEFTPLQNEVLTYLLENRDPPESLIEGNKSIGPTGLVHNLPRGSVATELATGHGGHPSRNLGSGPRGGKVVVTSKFQLRERDPTRKKQWEARRRSRASSSSAQENPKGQHTGKNKAGKSKGRNKGNPPWRKWKSPEDIPDHTVHDTPARPPAKMHHMAVAKSQAVPAKKKHPIGSRYNNTLPSPASVPYWVRGTCYRSLCQPTIRWQLFWHSASCCALPLHIDFTPLTLPTVQRKHALPACDVPCSSVSLMETRTYTKHMVYIDIYNI